VAGLSFIPESSIYYILIGNICVTAYAQDLVSGVYLVAEHWLVASSSRTTPSMSRGEHFFFIFLCLHPSWGKTFQPSDMTSTYCTHVLVIMTAIEFSTKTRSLEVVFDIFIMVWQIYGFNLWIKACIFFAIVCVGVVFPWNSQTVINRIGWVFFNWSASENENFLPHKSKCVGVTFESKMGSWDSEI